MSRLDENDIRFIQENIDAYDHCFKKQTGYYMEDVAKKAADLDKTPRKYRTAVVSVTSGLGVISRFAQTVCAILRHCSIDAFVTAADDVDGIYEAVLDCADIIFMADDTRFAAFGVRGRAIAENGICTGAGFAEALYCAMGKHRGKVLVLGASAVGGAAAAHLLRKGIPVDVYDTDPRVLAAAQWHGLTKLEKLPVLKKYDYIYDATTSAGFITAGDVTADTVIAAPGMPCGFTEEACGIATVIHNPLELGVLTMYCECAKKMDAGESGVTADGSR